MVPEGVNICDLSDSQIHHIQVEIYNNNLIKTDDKCSVIYSLCCNIVSAPTRNDFDNWFYSTVSSQFENQEAFEEYYSDFSRKQ